MADTFELIASTTLGSSAASIDFTSIPSTFQNLILKYSIRSATGGVGYVKLTLNGSTSSFSGKGLEGNGTGVSLSGTGNFAGVFCGSTDTANTFSNGEIYFPNYASSSYKSFSSDSATETNATESYLELIAGLWSNTAAITSISLNLSTSANIAQYSSAYLYGIKSS